MPSRKIARSGWLHAGGPISRKSSFLPEGWTVTTSRSPAGKIRYTFKQPSNDARLYNWCDGKGFRKGRPILVVWGSAAAKRVGSRLRRAECRDLRWYSFQAINEARRKKKTKTRRRR